MQIDHLLLKRMFVGKYTYDARKIFLYKSLIYWKKRARMREKKREWLMSLPSTSVSSLTIIDSWDKDCIAVYEAIQTCSVVSRNPHNFHELFKRI